MGTRNLTVVVFNKEIKVAQYGQWDGYPEGQGKTCLEFIKDANLDKFKKQLGKCRFKKKEDEKKQKKYLAAIGSKDGWLTMDQSKKYHDKFQYDNRDHGADILNLIYNADEEVILTDSFSFGTDSLFCEWAYVIDLDKDTFEIYKGFNKRPVPATNRWSKKEKDSEYYPVRLAKSYNLSKLPTEAKFIKDFQDDDEY